VRRVTGRGSFAPFMGCNQLATVKTRNWNRVTNVSVMAKSKRRIISSMLLLKIWVFASLPGALFLLLVTAFNFIRRLWS
jgi:hypothetical protein